MNIIPAILPTSQGELVIRASQVLGLVPIIQVDVCDGIFVPSQTHFDELPFRDQVQYELDLMVTLVAAVQLDAYIAMRPARIILHVEAIVENPMMYIHQIKSAGIGVGLALSNATLITAIEPYLNEIDFVQCMGIAHSGFQGQPFDEMVLEKIKELREKYPALVISVDGAVNSYTISRLAQAGANRFVVGSAIFAEGDVGENILELGLLVPSY
jgi:ribulose-phosphate 3-epimerase